MLALTRRRDPDASQESWLVYYDDVHVGTIAIRSGNPTDTDSWSWRCGFYPGSEPGDCTSGTATTFDQARFEAAWRLFVTKRTEADFQEWRDNRDWTAEKYRRFDRGERMPHGLARCTCTLMVGRGRRPKGRWGGGMNIRRGLFRLWILFSALWALACVSIAAVDGHWLERNRVYEIVDPNGGKYEVEAPANVSKEDVVDYVKKAVGSKWERAECTPRGPWWCDDPILLKMPRTDNFTRLIMVVVLPPIVIFVLGVSLYWALAGFKRGVA
jgi:hypothetical protein